MVLAAWRMGGKVAVERERRDWAAGSASDRAEGEDGRRGALGEAPGRSSELVTVGTTEEGEAEFGGGVAGGGEGTADHS